MARGTLASIYFTGWIIFFMLGAIASQRMLRQNGVRRLEGHFFDDSRVRKWDAWSFLVVHRHYFPRSTLRVQFFAFSAIAVALLMLFVWEMASLMR